MKTKITVALLLAVALVSTLGVLTAAADGPIAYLDNQVHQLAAGASALYRFDYSLDYTTMSRPMTSITLVNGTNSGLGFQVWDAQNINDMADNKPIGQGTPAAVDCTTGEISGSGGCLSPDLTWSGSFGASGPYYVLVTNSSAAPASFTLNIQGSGVSLGQMMAAAPSAPAAAPALPVASANTDDPTKAIAIDAASHSIPANSATWFSFNYQLNDDGSRPVRMITLANGAQNGLGFQVYSPDLFPGGWWNSNPTGQGTAQVLDCSTMEVAGGGGCSSPDLTWAGAFGAPGTYFVRVINSTSAPVNFTLTIQ